MKEANKKTQLELISKSRHFFIPSWGNVFIYSVLYPLCIHKIEQSCVKGTFEYLHDLIQSWISLILKTERSLKDFTRLSLR